jgi:hypothetical protein
MLAALALMWLHGKVPDQHRIRTAPAVRPNILVSHQDVTALGRDSDVASVQGGADGKDDLLPPLYECRLSDTRTWSLSSLVRSERPPGAQRLSVIRKGRLGFDAGRTDLVQSFIAIRCQPPTPNHDPPALYPSSKVFTNAMMS